VADLEQTAGVIHAERRQWHRRVAGLMQRHPWAARLLQRVYGRFQPRFTVGVVGVLVDPAGRVLLVEHIFHARRPWGLPGGWLARGEDPVQTVERELLEETGLRVRAVRPIVIQRAPDMRAHMDMAYLCELASHPQTIRLSHELLGYRWAPSDALPPLVAFHELAIREVQPWNMDD
jgi:8-oxo-dGTP diphosphatase